MCGPAVDPGRAVRLPIPASAATALIRVILQLPPPSDIDEAEYPARDTDSESYFSDASSIPSSSESEYSTDGSEVWQL